jgi:hypothetical protein
VPPEYINRYEISPKFDVFSLGVIIIQIMAGKESYPKCVDTSPEEFIQFVRANLILCNVIIFHSHYFSSYYL